LLYEDFVQSGMKIKPYADALATNKNITTAMPPAQTEKVIGAIKRCVSKYGTVAKVKQAHAKWVKENDFEYADISNLKKFAPEGQRAKDTDKTTDKRKQAYSALLKAGFSKHAAETALNICGVK
jgi:hypothetical protein